MKDFIVKRLEKISDTVGLEAKIEVKSDIDSVSRGPVQFVGQLSDDYGLNRLQLVYHDKNAIDSVRKIAIAIDKSTFEEFYYIFSPEILKIDQGKAYEMYFGAHLFFLM